MMSADFLLLFDSHDHRRHVNAESHIKGPNFRIFVFFLLHFYSSVEQMNLHMNIWSCFYSSSLIKCFLTA